jgi:hypothetical protein
MFCSSFFFIVLLLTLLSYQYEIKLQPCKNKNVPLYIKLLRFIHHFILIFQFVAIFKYPLLSIIINIIVKIHWIINNDKCILTENVNNYCGYNPKKFIALNNNFTKYRRLYQLILGIIGYYITNKKTEYINLILIYFLVSSIYKNKYKKI